jgi:hypothetical protein
MSNAIYDTELMGFFAKFASQRRSFSGSQIVDAMKSHHTRQEGVPGGSRILFEICDRRINNLGEVAIYIHDHDPDWLRLNEAALVVACLLLEPLFF